MDRIERQNHNATSLILYEPACSITIRMKELRQPVLACSLDLICLMLPSNKATTAHTEVLSFGLRHRGVTPRSYV